MTATTAAPTAIRSLDPNVAARIIEEGYGAGAWHGPDLKAALENVSGSTAFWRPGPNRHNIAEIALHHAWYVRSVVSRLTGNEPEPFILDGEDWFELTGKTGPGWPKITSVLDDQQRRLSAAVNEKGAVLPDDERFKLVLGITCHAVYHAGQIQLIKVLKGS